MHKEECGLEQRRNRHSIGLYRPRTARAVLMASKELGASVCVEEIKTEKDGRRLVNLTSDGRDLG